MDYVKLVLLGVIKLIAAISSSWARDLAYHIHALLIMFIAFGMFIWVLRNTDETVPAMEHDGIYFDGVIRAGVIATAFGASLVFWLERLLPSNWRFLN